MHKLFRISLVMVVIVVALGVATMPAWALAVNALTITGVSDEGTNCASITRVWITLTRTPEVDDEAGLDRYYITVYDAYGTPLLSDDFAALLANGTRTVSTTINAYVQNPPMARPFMLVVFDVPPGEPDAAVVESYPRRWTVYFDPADFGVCGDLPYVSGDDEPEEAAVPDCDVLIPIPATAVGGTFVADAPVYWAPGEPTSPLVTIPAGNSARVIGLDASGAYYQIVWVCDFLWVPVNTIGPNYDPPWNGAPLPTAIVG